MARRKRHALQIALKGSQQEPGASQAAGLKKSPAGTTAHRWFGLKELLLMIGLLAVVFLAYQPAWHGGFIWDDDSHVTRPELQSLHGLSRIWFDMGASLQYYPLLHSAFWIEHRLWGESPLGYHLVNILMHFLVAVMVAIVLRRLEVPGAYLAAAIFALHPVHVESVAWVTELKNTLSALFYLGSLLSYLQFDQTRRRSWYGLSIGLFAMGLLCKTVTGTLPGAILVILWWKRGRLAWKNDVLPVIPFFLLGAVFGAITAWWEVSLNQCYGGRFDFTLIERILIASRAAWFHLSKLFWPANLTFIYPRWQISQATWWLYVFPLTMAALLVALWMIRRRTRAPLAAVLFFGGTLVPVLGFFNLYTFRYSFVADHYQYLASLGIIALVSAGIALLLQRWRLWGRPGGYAICLALLTLLACLTWRQSGTYADVKTLYETTIERNPDCWLAYNNLGLILVDQGRTEEALRNYEKARSLQPDTEEVYTNLGLIAASQGRTDDAMEYYRTAIGIRPEYVVAHNNLANLLSERGEAAQALAHYQKAVEIVPRSPQTHKHLAMFLASHGRMDDAVAEYLMALKIYPEDPEAHNNLGMILIRCGQVDDGIVHFKKALATDPNYAPAHYYLGTALQQKGQTEDAIKHFRKALEIQPEYLAAYNDLGLLLSACGQTDDAIACFQKALAIAPESVDLRHNLGIVLYQHGRSADAMAEWRKVDRERPNNAGLLARMAWLLATDPEAANRNGKEAVSLAERAVRLSGGADPAILDVLAAAQAEAGHFAAAVDAAKKAMALPVAQNNKPLIDGLRARLKLYQASTPFRTAPQP